MFSHLNNRYNCVLDGLEQHRLGTWYIPKLLMNEYKPIKSNRKMGPGAREYYVLHLKDTFDF